jgi:ATP-dependent DNA ligase
MSAKQSGKQRSPLPAVSSFSDSISETSDANYTSMSLRERTRPGLGIIEPCLPSPAKAPPSGPGWIHEIKHDGFRILARRDSAGVRLITRAGNDFSSRFPFIAMAVGKLPVRSCLIDGEAIVCDESGLAVFELIRRHGALASAMHCAFDLLELMAGICAASQSRNESGCWRSYCAALI